MGSYFHTLWLSCSDADVTESPFHVHIPIESNRILNCAKKARMIIIHNSPDTRVLDEFIMNSACPCILYTTIIRIIHYPLCITNPPPALSYHVFPTPVPREILISSVSFSSNYFVIESLVTAECRGNRVNGIYGSKTGWG